MDCILTPHRHIFFDRFLRRFLSARFLPAALCACLAILVGGCGMPSLLITPVSSDNTLNEDIVQPAKGWTSDKVAIIQIDGMLMDATRGGLLQPTENDLSRFTQELKKAQDDSSVKAIVLRINSPGGTVTTSDTMYQMLRRFHEKTHKPIVACTLEMCASGAYYVACASDRIVAHPTSLVGSIGVIFDSLDFQGTLEKLGITANAITSGPLKDMGSPFKHLQPNERAIMQQMIDEYFQRFAHVVESRRPVKEQIPSLPMPADYAGIFSGRVFSGEEAVKLGLADQTGLLQDAINVAREMGHCPNAAAIIYRRPYGYGGSIFAQEQLPAPDAHTLQLNAPAALSAAATPGFYYLWQP